MFRASIAVVATEDNHDTITLEITSDKVFGGQSHTMKVSYDQYLRIATWYNGSGNIQDLLPEMSADQRELLMTGIDAKQWSSIFGNAPREAVSQ